MAVLSQLLFILGILAVGVQQSFRPSSTPPFSPPLSVGSKNASSASPAQPTLSYLYSISPSWQGLLQPTNLVNLTFENMISAGINPVCVGVIIRKLDALIDNLPFHTLVDMEASKLMGYCQVSINTIDLIRWKWTEVDPVSVKEISSIPWFCEMETDKYCDGRSDCLTDECGCKNISTDIFYCPNNDGCIDFPQLCDGTSDCPDGSDECLCEGFVKVECPTINSSFCLAQDEYCSFKKKMSADNLTCILKNKTGINCSDIAQNFTLMKNPFVKCVDKHHVNFMINRTSFFDLCRNDCSDITDFVDEQWYKFCDRIFMFNAGFMNYMKFICTPGPGGTHEESCEIENVCDGTAECSNGADELDCPGRFFCYPNSTDRMEWVAEDKLCDGVKDCSNGRDECDPCYSDGSSNKVIGSDILLIFTLLTGAAMIVINSIVGFRCYKSSPTTSAGKVDRFLCLQVLFFDWTMGLYNSGIVVATLTLHSKGSYCPQDETWRSSGYCQVLGMIFSIASHGSLSAIALMSVVRCINCISIHSRINLKTVIIVSTILIAITVVDALVPLLPFAVVQDMFRTEAFFKNSVDNPFITSNHVNVARLNEMHEMYFSYGTDIYTTVKNLNSITTKNTIFDIEEIGYYGNTPLCVHNVFKVQQSYLIYKLMYLTVLSLLLMIVTLTYVIIVRKQLLSRREVGDIGGGMNRQNAAAPSLTVKVSLMIGSQLASWLTFIGTAVYFQIVADVPSSQMFELIALVVLPINSVLNPIFYSELYKTIHKFILGSFREFTGSLLRKL